MLFGASALALLSVATGVLSQQTQCHDYVLISIRGTYEVQGPSIGFYGMINTTLRAVPNGIEYDAVYPAAENQTAYLGSDDVVRYITAGLASCPNQKYAILGYSQGASAAGIALRNYTDPSSPGYIALKAVVVIGNPYHRPNGSVNVDQNGTKLTASYPGVFEWNADQGVPDFYYNNGKFLDICYTADVVCAPNYPNSSFVEHLAYGTNDNVQKMGSDFLIARLSSNGTSTNSTSPSSTTAAPTGASSSAGPSSAAPSTPGAASGIVPNSILALVVGLIAALATSGL